MKSWNRRYFVLEDQKLSYYADQDQKKLKGHIALREVKSVAPMSYKGRKDAFELIGVDSDTNKPRKFHFSALKAEDVTLWIAAIEKKLVAHQSGGAVVGGDMTYGAVPGVADRESGTPTTTVYASTRLQESLSPGSPSNAYQTRPMEEWTPTFSAQCPHCQGSIPEAVIEAYLKHKAEKEQQQGGGFGQSAPAGPPASASQPAAAGQLGSAGQPAASPAAGGAVSETAMLAAAPEGAPTQGGAETYGSVASVRATAPGVGAGQVGSAGQPAAAPGPAGAPTEGGAETYGSVASVRATSPAPTGPAGATDASLYGQTAGIAVAVAAQAQQGEAGVPPGQNAQYGTAPAPLGGGGDGVFPTSPGLPSGWTVALVEGTNQPYYTNHRTQETTYSLPPGYVPPPQGPPVGEQFIMM